MSLTYSSFVTDLANIIVMSSADANYVSVLPNIVDDAEQRLYRELDFLNTVTVSSLTLASSTRTFTIPSSVTYVVVQDINYLSTADSRTPLIRVTREFVDTVCPTATSSSSTAVPVYYGMITDQQVVVGPPAGQAASLEVVGTVRPTALSSNNTTTYLSQYYPDLFMAAAVIFANGYLKNFSAMGDDPQAPATWERHLQVLLQSAKEEEQRKKGRSEGWTAQQSSPLAPRKP